MKFNNLHKKDIAREIIHGTRRRVPRTRCTTIEKEKLPQGDIVPSLFNEGNILRYVTVTVISFSLILSCTWKKRQTCMIYNSKLTNPIDSTCLVL